MSEAKIPLRILVVEDDPVIHREICEKVEEIGHDVVGSAYNNVQALELCFSLKPDLLLLDIVMPDSESGREDRDAGLELARILQNENPLPIIWLTVYESLELNDMAGELGIGAYLLKPVHINDLQRSITIAYSRFHDFQKQRVLNRQLQDKIVFHEMNEAKLLELQELLRGKNKTLERLFKIIGHDLKNTFYSILLGSESINSPDIEQESVHFLAAEIQKSAVLQQELLDNLLSWAQSQGAGEENNSLVDVSEIIQKALSVYARQSEIKHITVHADVEDQLAISADSQMLQTVIRNLHNNAVKFTPPGGTITWRVDISSEVIEIAVSDTGVGMDADKIAELFKDNVRVHKTQGTSGEKGTGLGLELCRDLIRTSGGELRVESTVGSGTTFTVVLPLTEAQTKN